MPKTKKKDEKISKKKPVKKITKTKLKRTKVVSAVVVEKETKEIKPERFFEATGRRKTAIARIRIFTKGEKDILVNDKLYTAYFPTIDLQQIATTSLQRMKCFDRFRILAKVRGGGLHAQAEAVRHGIARALVKFNFDFGKRLRKAGLLTRDPRMRERKKFGLKRARRAPQWAKR